ncbi:histidine kinase N-terminal 7TM domain-containing protein [Paenibacillus rigui]|uniref:histidine kinase n=1 Tax=Paenibacillus rigui TaxID=554312 RepID=A0A229UHC0_9BACL|nr:histidine kinase N-terminal 7TM domain-containing protein [Paenibacillus rigui]OXM82798.1 hypothetical protein CF651_29485 [Paenibacillus rigui]
MISDHYLFVILLAATFLMLFISFIAFKKRQLSVAKSCILLMLAASFYTFGYAFEMISTDLDSLKFWLKLEYIGIPFISTLWLILVIQFTGNERVLKRWVYVSLFIIPALTLILHYTNDMHHWFYRSIQIDQDAVLQTITVKGPWYWVHIAYSYLGAAIGMVLYVRMYLKAVPAIRKQIIVMMLGAGASWCFNIVYLVGNFSMNLDLTPIGFTITGVIYIWGIYRFNLMRLAPVAMEKVFETIVDGVIVLDYENHIIDSNQAAKNMFEELKAVNDPSAPIQYVLLNYPQILTRIRDMESSDCHVSIQSKEALRHYNFTISTILDSRRTPLGKLLMFKDITQLIESQEKLLANAKQLAEFHAFKDNLFTVVAHDIRDPLAMLMNLTELMEEELYDLGSENIEIVQEVKDQVRKTFHLAENLLDWFRSQKGKMMFSPRVWVLTSVVEDVVQTFEKRIDLKAIRIRIEIEEHMQITADRDMLDLILRNLLSNAIKFTGNGGYIYIGAATEGDSVIVSVKDTGMGIAPELTKSLLQDVQPVSRTGTEGEKGAGLGLILAREFLHIHGGTLWFESVPGEGSIFYFSLPFTRMDTDMDPKQIGGA